MSDSVRPHRQQPTRLPRPSDSPGKNTGVGCHFLFQCKKVKSEREVAQSYLTLSDPMDCSLPGSSVHGIFQARVLDWGAIAFSKDEGETPSKAEPEYGKPEGIEQKHRRLSKLQFLLHLCLGRKNFLYLLFLPLLSSPLEWLKLFLPYNRQQFCHPSRKIFVRLDRRVTWSL